MVAGHTDRLMPVCRMHIADIDWCIAEFDADARAGQPGVLGAPEPADVAHAPRLRPPVVGGRGSRDDRLHPRVLQPGGRSAAPELGEQRSRPRRVPGGRRRVPTRGPTCASSSTRWCSTVSSSVIPQLNVLIAECGYSWFLPMVHEFDNRMKGVFADGSPEESFYKLPLKPSEYLARQVKISPLPGRSTTATSSSASPRCWSGCPTRHVRVLERLPPHRGTPARQEAVRGRTCPPTRRSVRRFYGGAMADVLGIR